MHLLALGAIAALALVWPAAAVAVPVLFLTGYRVIAPLSVTRFRLEADGTLTCEDQPAKILSGTTVFVWMVVMRYRIEGKPRERNCVVLADSLPADDFRRLRIWLRWGARA